MSSNQTREFLTFRLGAEEYGIDILRVQEIRRYEPVTALPDAPAYVKGVLNLRGEVVPIIDMRAKLGIAEIDYGVLTVVIFLSIGESTIGAVVDSVSEVMSIDSAHISPPPELGRAASTGFIQGLAAIGERMIILLGVEQALESDGLPVAA